MGRLLIAWVCLGSAKDLPAQTVVGPYCTAAPHSVWIATPCPTETVWVVPSQPVTTYYPPADTNIVSLTAPIASLTSPLGDVALRVTVAESLVTRLMGREVTDAGPVRDCFLGADVYGNQFTVTRLSVDFQPCDTHARVLLRLTGSVSDSTVGVTRPAAVRSDGSHQFDMTKQVDFDGSQFTTRSPAAWVSAQINYRGASTVVSGVPVLGPIGSSIALSEAERRRPAAVQYATRRITQMAAPRFNREVDERLSDANYRLTTHSPMFFQMLGLSPSDQVLTTTDDRLHYGLRTPTPRMPTPSQSSGPVFLGFLEETSLEDAAEFAAPVFDAPTIDAPALDSPGDQAARSAPPSIEGRSATILVHQDFVNHVLDSLPLAGREVPDRQIDRMMEKLLDALARMSLDEMSFDFREINEPDFATLLLDQQRPVSIRFADGEAVVTLHAGFRAQLGRDVPTQRIEIPYRLSPGDDQLTLAPGTVTVTAASDADNGPLIAMARPVIQQQVSRRLQSIDVPRTIPLALPEMIPTTLAVRDVVLADGWLAITLD